MIELAARLSPKKARVGVEDVEPTSNHQKDGEGVDPMGEANEKGVPIDALTRKVRD
jgi:hypothetical protein